MHSPFEPRAPDRETTPKEIGILAVGGGGNDSEHQSLTRSRVFCRVCAMIVVRPYVNLQFSRASPEVMASTTTDRRTFHD